MLLIDKLRSLTQNALNLNFPFLSMSVPKYAAADKTYGENFPIAQNADKQNRAPGRKDGGRISKA